MPDTDCGKEAGYGILNLPELGYSPGFRGSERALVLLRRAPFRWWFEVQRRDCNRRRQPLSVPLRLHSCSPRLWVEKIEYQADISRRHF